MEQDVAQWQSVYSWCDGLLDRSIMVDLPIELFLITGSAP